MEKTGQDFLVGAFGLLTSLITATILVSLDTYLDFSLYSFTVWFVIPVGAIIAGFGAASGYYLGSRYFNHRPTRTLLWNMIGFSFGTFFLIHYMEYYLLRVDGRAVHDLISFGDYLSTVTSHTALEFRVRGERLGQPIELSTPLSFLFAFLQLLGFCAGGIGVFEHLKSQPYCDNCGKYFINKGRQSRYATQADELAGVVPRLIEMFGHEQFQEAVSLHASAGSERFRGKATPLASVIDVKYCKGCMQHWLKFSVSKLVGHDWKEIDDLAYETVTAASIDTGVKSVRGR